MTLAELQSRMSNAEFELWMAYEVIRNDSCPNCGVEPREMMDYTYVEVKCPTCDTKYGKTRRRE